MFTYKSYILAFAFSMAISFMGGGCTSMPISDLEEEDSSSETGAEDQEGDDDSGPGNSASQDSSSAKPGASSGIDGGSDTSGGNTGGGSTGGGSEKGDNGDAENGDNEEDGKDCPEKHPEGPDCDAKDIEGKLKCIEGLSILSKSSTSGGTQFKLEITQLVNHKDPRGPVFKQRLNLLHRSEDFPLVWSASGYHLRPARHELAGFFDANVISTEHRYFASSRPKAPTDWKFLTIEQAAADFHHIYTSMKWIYPKPWVSTGASKGGETALFHRRFYPCDVEATVAYVAPVVLGVADKRFNDFINTVGGDELEKCREDLLALQRELLKRRERLVTRLEASDYMKLGGPAVIYEHAVIELPFAFFQYQKSSACSQVPSPAASDDQLYEYISTTGQLRKLTDRGLANYAPYFYQAATQLGAPAGNLGGIKDLLKHADTYHVNSYIPEGIPVTFDERSMPDIKNWVKKNGQRLMFIYGEYDPWTAAPYELGEAEDSFFYMQPRGNHGANINGLPTKVRNEALDHLGRWLKAPLRTSILPPQQEDPIEHRGFLPVAGD